MKQENASERAVALVQLAVDLLRRAEEAPVSPVNTFLPAKLRRECRRAAARLRQGQVQPRYQNLYTAEQLADIYERTIRRDEILERVRRDLHRVALEFRGILETNGDEVNEAVEALIAEARRSMEKDGPESEAARRYRLMQFLGWRGRQSLKNKRRQKAPEPPLIPVIGDPFTMPRLEAAAAEVLPSGPSSGEAVIVIPPDGSDFGRGRVFIRIGTGERRWIGSFARGHAGPSTVSMLPDDKHLFVSAAGAGYIIDAKSRTLVETTGERDPLPPGRVKRFAEDLGVAHGHSSKSSGTDRAGFPEAAGLVEGFQAVLVIDDEDGHRLVAGHADDFRAVKLATGEAELEETN